MKKLHFILLALLVQPALASEKIVIQKDGSLSLTAPALDQSVSYEKNWIEKHPASEYEKYLKLSAQTPIRVPASPENTKVPDDLSKLKNDLYQLVNADALDTYIQKKVIPNYDAFSPSAKLVASQLMEFSVLRGFIYKMVPLVDQQKIAHSFLLTFVMRFATALTIYFPDNNQWAVGFNYLAEPYDGITQFTSVRDLQAFLNTNLYQAINESDLRLRQLSIPDTGVVWDNTILRSGTSYPDAFERYVYIQDAERYAWLAAKQRAMARMKTFCSYDLNDVFAINNAISKMQSEELAEEIFSGLLDRSSGQTFVQGMSSKDRNDKINDSRYPNFGRLWKGGGAMMLQALGHYQQMVSDVNHSWNSLNDKKIEHNRVLLQPGYAEIFDRRAKQVLPTWKDLLGLSRDGVLPAAGLKTHPVILASHLEGTAEKPEKVKVDVVGFFNHPPTNLRALLPSAYAANDQKAVWKAKGKFKYHNYTRGTPTQWTYLAYRDLFPDLATTSEVAGDKIKSYQKILSESWGGRFVSLPLASFLY